MTRVVVDGLPLQVRSAGIAVYTESVVRAMAALRPEVEFVLFGLTSLGLSLLRIQRPRSGNTLQWPRNIRAQNSLFYPAVMGYPLPHMPRLAKLEAVAGDSDLFHASNYALPRSRRTPLVVTVHDLSLLRFPHLGTPTLARFVRRMTALATTAHLLIAVSESTRRDLIELLGVSGERIRVVHNGYAPHFRPLPEGEARARVVERYGHTDPYILHVGTLEPRKNLAALIRAYARLRRDRQIAHRLVFVGATGWKYQHIFRLVEDLHLKEAVSFTGAVPADDLAALYGAADLFVYPSLYEGFGLPPLEAMACGTPVVTSNVSSLPEVVGNAALLVDPHDGEELAHAIHRALTDPALREQMKTRGLARAKLFSWQRCARETWAVYEEAVRGEINTEAPSPALE